MLKTLAKSRSLTVKPICSLEENKRQMSICLTNKTLTCLDKVLETSGITLYIYSNRKAITTAITDHRELSTLFFALCISS